MRTDTRTAARIVRWLFLAGSVAFFLFFSRFISEHAICPIGGFELFFNGLFSTGFSLAGLFSGMVLTFLFTSVLSILFRRAYCGYLCPVGAVQELFERTGKLVLPRQLRSLRIPAKIDRALRWAKYAVLGSFVVGAAVWGGHWMIAGDPFMVFMSLSSPSRLASTAQRLPGAAAFLAAILVFAFFFGRGFCKYLCPAGAWYALLSRISPNRVVRNEAVCVGCGRCAAACPMGIDVAHSAEVKSAECIGCRECVNVCPKAGALSAPVASVSVPAALVPVASAAAFAGGVFLAASSMPARGPRPEGPGGERGRGGRPDAALQGAPAAGASLRSAPADGDGDSGGDARVGWGGCEACIACGFCGSASRA